MPGIDDADEQVYRGCRTPNPDWEVYRSTYTREFFLNAVNADNGQTIYVDIKYSVLFSNDEEFVSEERIKDMHRVLTECFTMSNTAEISQIPQNTRYPYRNQVGNPNIKFLPEDADKVTVQYYRVSGSLDSSAPVTHAAEAVAPESNVLNIYVANSGNGSILGQAELSSNIVYVLYKAAGGRTHRGTLALYDHGKTAVHEVGHSFSLVHPFTDSSCNGTGPYPDIPEQIKPNYKAVTFVNGGEWDTRDDNRYKDRAFNTSLSCLGIAQPNFPDQNEFPQCIMDYGYDSESRAFTAAQVTMMRSYLLGSGNTTIDMKSAGDESYSEKNPTTVHDSVIDLGSTGEDTDLTLIIVGAVLGVVVVAVVIGISVQKSMKKYAHSYTLPETIGSEQSFADK